MANQPDSDAQARRLLTFYAPEIVQLALVCRDANPGDDVFGVVMPSSDELPDEFVGSKHEEIARGVVRRAAITAFLRRISPSAADQLPPATTGRTDRLTAFVFLDGKVLGTTLALPDPAR